MSDPLHGECFICRSSKTLDLLVPTREGFRCRSVNNCIHAMCDEYRKGSQVLAERNKKAILERESPNEYV